MGNMLKYYYVIIKSEKYAFKQPQPINLSRAQKNTLAII